MEVWLVAFQDALQRELAHAQHLQVQVHNAFAPRSAILVLEQPQVEDLMYPENSEEPVSAAMALINLTLGVITLGFHTI